MSENEQERELLKVIIKYAERLLDKKYFDRASQYVSPPTKDEDAFKALCSEAGIPDTIPGFSEDLHEYLFKCATKIPPINMMW